MGTYKELLEKKSQGEGYFGFDPMFLPPFLFDFQKALVEWAVKKGKAAIYADCGLGKTPMQLVWAENIVRKTNKPVLILTPLAVSYQTISEAAKFGIEAMRSHSGEIKNGIIVTNYERLHFFNPGDFGGCVCDESSILKSFDGTRKAEITEFIKKMKYRLLCTATAAPNDYIELGTSAEALGELGYMDMLAKFFKNDQHSSKPQTGMRFSKVKLDETAKWRFKGHAEIPFWRWVGSWARAIRKPSDLGFSDARFALPPLVVKDHMVEVKKLADGFLFPVPARGLKEQRDECRRSIRERCEKTASLVDTGNPVLVWCNLNDEGDLLQKLIPGSVQISGKDSDEEKEERFISFSKGQTRVLITKPKIGAWGMNFQHCSHLTFFPTHSFEQYYQGVRRCWRFGQIKPVLVDVITTEGEREILKNLNRKEQAASKMFDNLVLYMNDALKMERKIEFTGKGELPSWI